MVLRTLNTPKVILKISHLGNLLPLRDNPAEQFIAKEVNFFYFFLSYTIITIVNASFKCDFSCGKWSEFNVIINVFPCICFAAISPLHQPAYPILDCDAEAQLKALNGFIMVIDPNSEVFYVSETVEQYLGFHQVSWFLYTFKFSTTFHLYVEGNLTEQYLFAMMIYLREILEKPNG